MNGSGSIRVLVVDDSTFMRRSITRMLSAEDDIDVVGAAASAEEALSLVRELEPDVVTLDVVMPGMDGLQMLGRLMAVRPTPVIMVSELTAEDATVTLECLEAGAVDVVKKPGVYTNMNMPSIASELCDKVRIAAGVDVRVLTPEPAHEVAAASEPVSVRAAASSVEAVVIGCSTGGPSALQRLLPALPSDLPVPVVVVQHMPHGFTEALATRLDALCPLKVSEARDGDVLRPGRVLVARAGRQLRLERRGERVVGRLRATPSDTPHLPSIDVTMSDAAEVYGARSIGVVLTGMGDDGASGLLAMRSRGAFTIAEARSSAVVYGMPKVAARMDAACEVLDLSLIAHRLSTAVIG